MKDDEGPDIFETVVHKVKNLHHYYGDYVRNMFLIGAAIALLSFPLYTHLLPVPIIYPIAAIAVLVVAAGLTNPAQKWTMILNVVVAAAAIIFFEHQALLVNSISTHNDAHQNILFIESHALALLFLFALYYGIKTVRGRYIKGEMKDVD